MHDKEGGASTPLFNQTSIEASFRSVTSMAADGSLIAEFGE
jgi:hypothetical protein